MIKKVEEEMERCLGDYGFTLEYEIISSYFDEKKEAVEVMIKALDKVFYLKVEEHPDHSELQFESGEDNWVDITQENIFKCLFFKALYMDD